MVTLWRPCHQPRLLCISISAGQYCRPSFGIRLRESTWTRWLPFWTTLEDSSKACSILLKCCCDKSCRGNCKCSRSLEMWRGMCQQWRRLIYLLIYWLAGNCHNSSNLLFFSYEYAEQGNSCSVYLCYFKKMSMYIYRVCLSLRLTCWSSSWVQQ